MLVSKGIPNSFDHAMIVTFPGVFSATSGVIFPLLAPILSILRTWTMVTMVFKVKNATPQVRRWCRNAILYYQGAYGIPAHAIGSTLWVIGLNYGVHTHYSAQSLLLIGCLFLLTSAISQATLGKKFPIALFSLMGYDTTKYRFGQKTKPVNHAPWGPFQIVQWINFLFTFAVLWLIVEGVLYLSYGITYARVWVKVALTGQA
jgi:hypothetical protein